MNWYKDITNFLKLRKIANKTQAKEIALQQLNTNVPPQQVVQDFMSNMIKIDPSFPASVLLPLRTNPDALRTYLEGLSFEDEAIAPQAPQTPQIPDQLTEEPGAIEPESAGPEQAEEVTEETGQMVSDTGETIMTDQLDQAPDMRERITVDPTLKGIYEVPVAKITQVNKKLGLINKKLRSMYHPEIKMEVEGDTYLKPILYPGRYRPIQEPFVRIRVSGTLPSPSELVGVRIKENVTDRKGKIVYEEDGITPKTKKTGDEQKGVRFIAKVHHHPLSDEEQTEYLKTEPPDSYLRKTIAEAQQKGITPFYNTIEGLEKNFKIDPKFWYSRPQDCFSCKVRHARLVTFVGAVVPPEEMVEKKIMSKQPDGSYDEVVAMTKVMNKNTGQLEDVPVKVIPEDLVAKAPQEQFGGACADRFDAVKTIDSLKKWIDDLKNAEKKKTEKKPPKKYTGGTRGGLPAEGLFAAAINILRNPKYTGRGLSAWTLSNEASNYNRYLSRKKKEEEEQVNPQKTQQPYNRYRYGPTSTTIEDYDVKMGNDVRRWWRQKMGGIDLEKEDHNKISLSILPTIQYYNAPGRRNMSNIIEMVEMYLKENNIQLEPLKIKEPEPVPQQPFRPPVTTAPPTRPTTILDEPIEPAVPPVPEPEPAAEPEGPVPEGVEDIRTLPQGQNFVSKFKFKETKEWSRGGGVNHIFLDDANNKYIIFEKYTYDRDNAGRKIKRPLKQFEPGQSYYLKGRKGSYNTRYRTTVLENAEKVTPEAPVPEEPITPEAPVVTEPAPSPAVPAEPEKPKFQLPPWYGKYDVSAALEQMIRNGRNAKGDPVTIPQTINLFTKTMARISEKWQDEEFRTQQEHILNIAGVKDKYGGKEGLIKRLQEIYEQDRPQI